MKRLIKASYDKVDTLNFVLDENERERYIHTLIGEIQDILFHSKGIKTEIYDIDYNLIIDILGISDKDIIDTITIPYSDIIYDWDDVYFAATKIVETIMG